MEAPSELGAAPYHTASPLKGDVVHHSKSSGSNVEMGQKPTWRGQVVMSALPPKATELLHYDNRRDTP
jgi:hypothetical protein